MRISEHTQQILAFRIRIYNVDSVYKFLSVRYFFRPAWRCTYSRFSAATKIQSR